MSLMLNRRIANSAMYRTAVAVAFAISGFLLGGPANGATSITGRVLGAGAPIANSAVTLWAASADAPKQLAQTQTGADGRFSLEAPGTAGTDSSLYLSAKGGQPTLNKTGENNPAIALIAVVAQLRRPR
jgi:hypothetical protein